MSSDRPPPPYQPLYPEAPAFPPVLSSQHATVPGSPFQNFMGGGDQSYYSGPPEPMGPSGTFYLQPGYQGYHAGPRAPLPYSETPKQPGRSKVRGQVYQDLDLSRSWSRRHGGEVCLNSAVSVSLSVYMLEQQEPHGGADESCLTGLLPALCCCCLWNVLFRRFC
ncbi:cysteine-rich and transmembrane domain-containing protein 1 isoform X1 [Cynoglossus semilaevis]|uniref:cysteine-rich and transmembrane domain-containing protein 1 isoform X1 n=1 Tax=Cynoglossus semilaevis TaxID=244447 RepID=UPI0007DC8DBD|nr:cysteine-rich and transmembrane domain-containing protein 1 isoform X1 [Cynoglossus semilaevis]